MGTRFFFGGWGPGHGKLEKPPHQKALEKSLGIKDQSCPMLRLSHKASEEERAVTTFPALGVLSHHEAAVPFPEAS